MPVIVHVEAVVLLVGAGSVVLVPLTVAVKVKVFPSDPDDPVTVTVGVFFETVVVVVDANEFAVKLLSCAKVIVTPYVPATVAVKVQV